MPDGFEVDSGRDAEERLVDDDKRATRALVGVVAGCFLMIGGCISGSDELRMRVGADIVEGRVTKVRERTSKGRLRGYNLWYTFRDADEKRHLCYVEVGTSWTMPPGLKVESRYDTDNPEISRLEENGGMTPVYILLGGLALLGIGIYSLVGGKP